MNTATALALALALATVAHAQVTPDDPGIETRRSLNALELGGFRPAEPSIDAGATPDACVAAADCAQPGDFAVFINASFFDSAEVIEFAEAGALTRICTTFVFAGGSCPALPSDPMFNETWAWDFYEVDSMGIPSSGSAGRFDTEFPLANLTVENFFVGTIGAGFPVFNFEFDLGMFDTGMGIVTGFPVGSGDCFALQPKFALPGCSTFWETSSNKDGSPTGDGLFLQDALMNGYDTCDYTANDLLLCLDVLTTQPPTCTANISIDAPVNDNCEGAAMAPLACDATNIHCLLFATQNTQDDPALPCTLGEPDDFTGHPTAFFTFTPTSSRALLSMCRVSGGIIGGNAPFPNGDFILALYEYAQTPGTGEGPCDLIQIACSDNNCSLNKPILCLNDLDPMTTYVVEVAGHDDLDGIHFELDVTCDPREIPPVPDNDDCTDATPLTFPIIDEFFSSEAQDPSGQLPSGNTFCATLDPIAGSCGGTVNGNSPGLWFTFIGTGMNVRISMCGSSGGSYDSQMNVYCGDCTTGLICLAGNDDAIQGGCAPMSEVVLCTEAGRPYYIYTHGNFDVGEIGLVVRNNPNFEGFCTTDPTHEVACFIPDVPCPPDADIIEQTDAAALMEVCGDDVNSGCVIDPDNGTAFIEAGTLPFTSCGQSDTTDFRRDIDAYRFTVNARSVVTIDLLAEFNPALFLFDSDDCATQLVVLNESSVAGTTLTASAVLNPGVYVLRVTIDGFTGAPCGITNDYVLSVQAEPLGRCCIVGKGVEECCVTTERDCSSLAPNAFFEPGLECEPLVYEQAQVLTIAPFESITEQQHAMTIDGGDGDGFLGDDDAQTVIINGPDSQLTDFLGNPGEFPFEFFNECVRSITVHSNGYISFDRGLAPVNDNTPEPIPTPGPAGTLNNFIAPLWTDLDPGTTGEVALLLDGVAPFRRLIIEWHNVPNFNQVGTINTFQLVLFEGADCARFLYNDIELPVIVDPMDPEYAVGVENQDGTQGAALTEAEIEALDTSMLTEKEARIVEFCPVPDMVAFEPCEDISDECVGDCDGNGAVEFNDLVAMLFEFGNMTDLRCDADMNGTVEFNDLVTALFLFGPCP